MDKYDEYSSDEEEYSPDTPLNDESLLQLKNNDPKLTQLTTGNWKEDSYARKVDWRSDVGTFEGNTNLKKLDIDFAREEFGGYEYEPLCDNAAALGSKLSSICSVEGLSLSDIGEHDDRVFASIVPLFENSSNLIHIHLGDCNFTAESTRLLASALSKQQNKGSLKDFSLCDAYFGWYGSDTAKAELITALGGYHSLKNLNILDGGFEGREFHVALANMLRNPQCIVKRLSIGSIGLDSECCSILLDALTVNTSVKDLNLQGSMRIDGLPTMVRDVSAWLQNNSTVQHLDLHSCNITDQDITTLGNALMRNSTLETLNIAYSSSITSAGWQYSLYTYGITTQL